MDKVKIGQRLTRLRGFKSRNEVAEDLNISYHSIRAYESGYRIPGDSTKIMLAEYYGVTVSEIFYE